MRQIELVIIGGGPAGLAAALEAKKSGITDILILERDRELGGILNQCIHNGFGLHTFKEELTGPEYAARFIELVKQENIPFLLHTMVMDITKERLITAMNRENGMFQIQAKAIILAMGCRERARGALNIPGYRPAGIYSAGTAQRLVNMEGQMPGKRVVILGSGDIGLIMARRMTLEGAKVLAVAELMSYSGGLKRNIVQCLDDYDIPLLLSHTVTEIRGKERLSGITLMKVDADKKPIPGTEIEYECDTLLLSVGLVPENELSREMGVTIHPLTNGPIVDDHLETSVEGVFACGNVLHVHDLVDFVSQEAALAGKQAAQFIQEKKERTLKSKMELKTTDGVRYCIPNYLDVEEMDENITIRLRVTDSFKNKKIQVMIKDQVLYSKKKNVLAPGEMEEIRLSKEQLFPFKDERQMIIRLEDGVNGK
ncbi:MAG: FAD-dependent oxidoreductase [Lachnospiraceae bacterium]|nr:FAD-dependent oxidoreductase [Lachnospiraceae bacterium]